MAENHLLELLTSRDRRRLIAACDSVHLTRTDRLSEYGAATRHVYFPQDGFVSLLVPAGGQHRLEVAMVGREGIWGAHVALGVDRNPLQAQVQGAGGAWRMTSAAFARELSRSTALTRLVKRYLYVLMAQFAASSACVHYHRIDQRLARWLLMTRDRAASDRFRVTHEFLAHMLGVRRVGVTTAASDLQRLGLIEYHRGDVTVLDRKGLRSAACACYAADCHRYREVMVDAG